MKRQIFSISLLLILLITFLPGCTPPGMEIMVNLSFSEPPILNKPVKIIEIFSLREGFSTPQSISAYIFLPESFVKINGDVEWVGTISPGETKTLTATVKSTKPGIFQVKANAGWPVKNPSHVGGIKELYINISEKEAIISDRVPTAKSTLTATTWGNTSDTYYNPPGTTTQSFTGTTPTPTVSFSQTPYIDPLTERVVKADLIVLGSITDKRYGKSEGIFTDFTLTIEKVIKGDDSLKEVLVRCDGGIYDNRTLHPIDLGPNFSISDKIIVCLKKIDVDNTYIPFHIKPYPIEDGVSWIESKTLHTEATIEEVIARLVLIMKANNIPIALPESEIPPLPGTTKKPK
jgi:hypothetical protein